MGFVLIALDVEAMLTQQVMDFVGGDLEVAVVDAGVPEGRGLLFGPAELAEADTANEPGALLESRGLAVPARGWQISYRPSVDLLDRLETQEPALIAAAGVLLSAIGAAWLGMMTHGRLAVRRLVDVRTLELRRAAEALRQNEQRFRSLFANMRDLVFCRGAKGQDRFGYDREGSIIYGRDAPKLTGAVDGDNFALDVWYESIHPDDRPAYEAAERRRKEEGRDFSLDYRLIHPVTGELRWMRETAWVVEDPETGQTFFDSYILDITDERRIADQLREAKTEAERASRAKSEFLANMSHEIRTPLNAILGFSEAMRMEIFGPMGNARYADYAGHICDSAEHLLSLINDLLDLSKVEAGKLELEETAIDPAAVVEEACRLVSAAAADNGVALLRRLPDQSPALWGDRRLVRQVLLNLLTNAVKFTPAAGRVTVSVSTEEDRALAVRVEDTKATKNGILGCGECGEMSEAVLGVPRARTHTSRMRTLAEPGPRLPLARRVRSKPTMAPTDRCNTSTVGPRKHPGMPFPLTRGARVGDNQGGPWGESGRLGAHVRVLYGCTARALHRHRTMPRFTNRTGATRPQTSVLIRLRSRCGSSRSGATRVAGAGLFCSAGAVFPCCPTGAEFDVQPVGGRTSTTRPIGFAGRVVRHDPSTGTSLHFALPSWRREAFVFLERSARRRDGARAGRRSVKDRPPTRTSELPSAPGRCPSGAASAR